ncbi:MAG: hypothetical protein ACREMP_04210 [Candidatus Tyrphobacter sp.]
MALGSPCIALAHNDRHGQQSGGPEQATIAGSAFAGASGSIKVNEAAGNGNAQANIAVLSSGSATHVSLTQRVSGFAHDTGIATIADGAFAGASGALQLNQAAGSGNAQGNVIVVQLGGAATSLSDAALSSAVASSRTSGTNTHSSGGNVAGISGRAFSGASGVVQINQTAGSSNRTTNSFQLQLQPGPGT